MAGVRLELLPHRREEGGGRRRLHGVLPELSGIRLLAPTTPMLIEDDLPPCPGFVLTLRLIDDRTAFVEVGQAFNFFTRTLYHEYLGK